MGGGAQTDALFSCALRVDTHAQPGTWMGPTDGGCETSGVVPIAAGEHQVGLHVDAVNCPGGLGCPPTCDDRHLWALYVPFGASG